jgi:hypothetical protein
LDRVLKAAITVGEVNDGFLQGFRGFGGVHVRIVH